jgi:acyl-coenzyme A synthetase/AMP-(fatty) acid ligase
LTTGDASVCIDAMKWFAWLLLVFLFATANSCTTLVNRRDLYSPEPGPDSLEAARQWYGTTTTHTTATTIRSEETVPATGVRRY